MLQAFLSSCLRPSDTLQQHRHVCPQMCRVPFPLYCAESICIFIILTLWHSCVKKIDSANSAWLKVNWSANANWRLEPQPKLVLLQLVVTLVGTCIQTCSHSVPAADKKSETAFFNTPLPLLNLELANATSSLSRHEHAVRATRGSARRSDVITWSSSGVEWWWRLIHLVEVVPHLFGSIPDSSSVVWFGNMSRAGMGRAWAILHHNKNPATVGDNHYNSGILT